jgi:hypothetical protein
VTTEVARLLRPWKKEERAIEAGETPAPRQVPKTIENQRVKDETFVEAGDNEVAEEDAEAGAYTRSLSVQLEPCLTHRNTLHPVNTT